MRKNIFKFLLLILACICLGFGYFQYNINFNEIAKIKHRGVLLVGTTADYCPMSCVDEKSNKYVGYDIALAEDLANSLGVNIQYVKTSWPTLMQDVKANKFDIALSGITITDARKKEALMSEGYLNNGKTILCRKNDIKKYPDLNSVNHPSVRVMENPGGLNEKFARENLKNSTLIIHNINYEIPSLIAKGKADVMITEIIEAEYYSNLDNTLAAPLSDKPFTRGQIGMLLPDKNKKLLNYVNKFIQKERKSGRLDELKTLYIHAKRPLNNI